MLYWKSVTLCCIRGVLECVLLEECWYVVYWRGVRLCYIGGGVMMHYIRGYLNVRGVIL